jgi:hypothetical protein
MAAEGMSVSCFSGGARLVYAAPRHRVLAASHPLEVVHTEMENCMGFRGR